MKTVKLFLLESAPTSDFPGQGRFAAGGSVHVRGEEEKIVSFYDPETGTDARPLLRLAVANGFPVRLGDRTTFFGEIVDIDGDRFLGRLEFYDRGQRAVRAGFLPEPFSLVYAVCDYSL